MVGGPALAQQSSDGGDGQTDRGTVAAKTQRLKEARRLTLLQRLTLMRQLTVVGQPGRAR